MDPTRAMTLLNHAKRKYEDLTILSASSEAEIRQSCDKSAGTVAAKKYLKTMDALSELESAMAPFMPPEDDSWWSFMPPQPASSHAALGSQPWQLLCALCRSHDALGDPCTQCRRLCCQACLFPEPCDVVEESIDYVVETHITHDAQAKAACQFALACLLDEPVLVDKWCRECVQTWHTTGPDKAATANKKRKQLNRPQMQEHRARSSTEDS